MTRKRVAVLISGRGSNMASLLMAAAAPGYPAEIVLVISNRADAGGPARAAAAGVATAVVDHRGRDRGTFEAALDVQLRQAGAEIICLAGFMRLLSGPFVERWQDRILNIHPSLLPAFPGLDTHQRALAAGVKLHGCTVHFIRAAVDDGPIVAQAAVPVLPDDTADTLAARVLAVEHRLYPHALALVASGRARVTAGGVAVDGVSTDIGADADLAGAVAAMNYRHAFHAGNFADVVKHAVLALLVERLQEKPAAFRVIDTHAGPGLYDLTGDAAERTGEWHEGIGRIWRHSLSKALTERLAPYQSAVTALNSGPALARYPGSPWIVRHLLRRQDRLTAVELHPEDAAALAANFAGDIQVRTVALDGWLALGAFVPPKERRGLVLVDPPYEERNEFERLFEAFLAAHRRWPTGIYALWYPVKDIPAVSGFRTRLAKSGVKRLIRVELTVRGRGLGGGFNGAGMVLCNAPWRFAKTLEGLLAGLTPLLAQGSGAGHMIDEIAGE